MDNPQNFQTPAARRAMVRRNIDNLGIKYDELPRLPFWAPLFGRTQAWYKFEIAEIVVNATVALGRGLTPEERDILSYLSAKTCATLSYEPPISFAVAMYMERRGRPTSKFPFYTPKATSFDPSFFPSRRVSLLQGTGALMAWNSVRFGCYAFVAHFIGGLFFSSYTASVQAAHVMRDPRLADLRKGLADRTIARRRGSQAGPPWEIPSKPEDPSMQDAETPYGGVSYEEPRGLATTEASVNQARGESNRNTGTTGAYQRTQGSYAPRLPPVPVQSADSGASEDFTEGSFFDDDASPVAPAARTGNATSGSGVSAWERLRQQAQSQSSSTVGQGDSSRGSRSRGSGQDPEQYAYSRDDEDKALAKDQAQKEFDAMLEKERQGETDSVKRRW